MDRDSEHEGIRPGALVRYLAASVRIGLVAFAGLSVTGCTVTLDNGSDAGDGSAQDSGAGVDSSAGNDSGTPTADSGGDATVSDGGTGDDGATTGDGSSPGDGGTPGPDAGLGGSCVAKLYGTYVQRTDGALLAEGIPGGPSAEQDVVDSATGMPLAGIASVQEGQTHGCAAVSGGSAKCWLTSSGSNTSGQLGNGTTTAVSTVFRATPVLTAASTPLANVVSIADGFSNSGCAVTSDSKVWCWGDLTWIVNNGTTLLNGYAQVITTDGATPLKGVVQAVLGFNNACALVQGSPNTVWCWGQNSNGEVGQGDTTRHQYPTQVVGFTSPTVLVAAQGINGSSTMCALDGADVRCWGQNGVGAAGVNSTTTPILSPTLVLPQTGSVALTNIVDVRPGASGFSVLRSDNTMWTWGTLFGTIYAANYGLTNVLAIGWGRDATYAGGGPRYLTSDGVYHNAMTSVTVKCGAL